MSSFKHSGDLGDIIFALPAVRALTESKAAFYLSQWPGRTRVTISHESLDFLRPLLEAQDYIRSVEMYRGQSVCYDLDAFRKYWADHANEYGVSLAEWHCRAFDVDCKWITEPWLETIPKRIAAIVIHRSDRYQNGQFPWKRVRDKYHKQAVFVGLQAEHEKFIGQFGFVPFYECKDGLDMAMVVEGCSLFIGNQSFPNALAEGLKKPKITEIFMVDPNCCYERADAQYVCTKNVYLPDL